MPLHNCQEEKTMKNIKKGYIFLVIAVFLLPALLIAGGQNKELPQAEEQDFLKYVAQPFYRGWDLWPGKEKLYEGTEPHGVLLTTYVNDIAKQALEEGRQEEGMPDGSIIVKENYSEDKKLVDVTAMFKKTGFNPEAGDWFWIKFEPKGEVDAAGKVEGCINCHQAAAGNDYLLTRVE
jgi:hypothetical protein